MTDTVEDRLKKLFVGGLDRGTSDETLKEYFGAWGETTDCVVIRDSQTKNSRGFGYVTYVDPEAAAEVLRVKRDKGAHVIDSKAVEVKRAIPRDDQSSAAHVKTRKVFVGGIPPEAEEEDIRKALQEQGHLSSEEVNVDLIRHKDTDKHRGFCFVELANEDDVDTLCCVKRIDLKGKKVEVKKAEPKGGRGEDGGRGGSRGGRGGGFRGGRGGGFSNSYQQPSYGGYDTGYGGARYQNYSSGYQDPSYGSYASYGSAAAYGANYDPYGAMGMYPHGTSGYGPSRGGAGAKSRYQPY